MFVIFNEKKGSEAYFSPWHQLPHAAVQVFSGKAVYVPFSGRAKLNLNSITVAKLKAKFGAFKTCEIEI